MSTRILSVIVLGTLLPHVALADDYTPPSTVFVSSSPTSGRYVRGGLGASLFVARGESDDEPFSLIAPGALLELSYGHRFRDRNALQLDFFAALGPAPTVTYDGETDQLDDASYQRISLGVGYTRFAHPDEGFFFTFGAGGGYASLSLDEDDLAGALSVGGYATLGLGREWAVAGGIGRIGVLTRATFEAYRTIDAPERYSGVSVSVLFTVSLSHVGVGRHTTHREEAPEETPPAPPVVVVQPAPVITLPAAPVEITPVAPVETSPPAPSRVRRRTPENARRRASRTTPR